MNDLKEVAGKEQAVVGLRLGGPEARLKRGAPLMTSSYSANRDKHFDQA